MAKAKGRTEQATYYDRVLHNFKNNKLLVWLFLGITLVGALIAWGGWDRVATAWHWLRGDSVSIENSITVTFLSA